MENKKEIEKELRLLAQRIRHEVKPKAQEKMLDHIRNILTLIEGEKCTVCKKPMCFERMNEEMPHEYDVCIECGKHICIECSKMVDTVPYCPECYKELKCKT